MDCDCLILGAGITGSAAAYELSRRGLTGIHVIDPDLEGELSATERNAGGVRHLWQHPVNVELSRISIQLFEKIRSEIGFQQNGYLWLFAREQTDAAERLLEHTRRHRLEYEPLGVEEIRSRYPFLDKTDDLGLALFGKRDGLINSNALKLYFRNEAKSRGVVFHDRCLATDVRDTPAGAEARVMRLDGAESAKRSLENPDSPPSGPTEIWRARTAVICMDAWAGRLPLLMPLSQGFRVVRRQISLFKTEGLDLAPYGMIVDTSRVYFHAEGGNALGGLVLKDEPPGFDFRYDNDFFETHIWPALYERGSAFERLKPIGGWAGLYSYTPDTTGVLGWVPGCRHVAEAHSFTGRGVMQSYGAAVAVAELLLDGKFTTIDAAPLSRARFQRGGPWLEESLHI